MIVYARTEDPIGTWNKSLKHFFPNTSDPSLFSNVRLAEQGISVYELVYDPLEWWQKRGDPVLEGNTIRFPSVDQPHQDVKAIAKHRIDQQRDELQVSPFDCEFTENQFQTRPIDRENLLGAALDATIWIQSGGDPDTLYWDSSDPEQAQGWIAIGNDVVPMSAAQLIQFARNVQSRHKRLIFQGRMKKDAVEQAQSVSEIVGIVDAGWE